MDVLRLEQSVGLDVEDEVQAAMLSVDGLATAANWIYIWGHWPVIVLTLLWLALHDRVVFRKLRNAIIASGLLGLCVYTTYPVAPPRLAGLGLVDTVTETSRAYRVLQPPAFVNQYAAMPSLHVGWDLLVGLALVAAAGTTLLRVLGRTMPAVMALATVLTANHYVLDVVAGAAFGLAGWTIALGLERRSRQREQRRLGRERRLLAVDVPPELERRLLPCNSPPGPGRRPASIPRPREGELVESSSPGPCGRKRPS
ncbi:MAG: phosphoesterase, PA-phosphatase related protein [Frankiales bacterium]|jgi:membrane-associated phospholipid phosphatase|nr:phosphoesterase, PA-phosphatase related protein [Frankiales bacterium]